jgi:hypothetical protein
MSTETVTVDGVLYDKLPSANGCTGCAFDPDVGTDRCHQAGSCDSAIFVVSREQQRLEQRDQATDQADAREAAATAAFEARKAVQKAMILSADPQARKSMPITSGVLDYFPLAIAEVAKCSKAGNDQHNPGQPLHWDKTKSTDHADCIARHLIDRGTVDTDGIRHSAKLAWRALANLQFELEAELA